MSDAMHSSNDLLPPFQRAALVGLFESLGKCLLPGELVMVRVDASMTRATVEVEKNRCRFTQGVPLVVLHPSAWTEIVGPWFVEVRSAALEET